MNPIEMLKADVRKIDKQFLDKFKSLPGLWDPSHAEYCNKYHRMDNLKKLLPILQNLKPNATVFDVKMKINTFRTNYRKEYNRIMNYISQNPEKKEFIKPRLWYFKSLTFLNNIKSKHNLNETNELTSIKFSDTSNESDENNGEKEPVSMPSTSSTSQTRPLCSSPTIATAFSLFKPEPFHVENDETAGSSKVDDEIDPSTGPAVVEDDEIEPMKDPTKIMECERNFLIMFRKLQGLWNPADPYYTNRVSRYVDLNKLLPFLKEINPKATIVDVRKKINTFRSNYRRENKKIEHSRSVNNDPSLAYKPKLWYYKYMSFLNDLDDSKMQEEHNEDEESNDDVSFSEFQVHSPTSSTVTINPRKRKASSERQPVQEDNQDQEIQIFKDEWDEAPSNLKRKVSTENTQHPKELNITESATWTQLFKNQEKQIQNPIVFEWDETLSRLDSKQRLFAKKAINDILYEAELGNLNVGSVKINQPSVHGQSSVYQFDQPSSSSQFDQSSHGKMRVGENIILVKMEGSGDPLS